MVNWKNISSEFNEELQKEWESKGFNYQQTKEWIDIGLGVREADLAGWIRDIKEFDSEWVLNYLKVEDLRQEFREELEKRDKNKAVNAQEWLDKNYPKKKRKKVKEIKASNQRLEGNLDLSDFVNLERLEFFFNELTEIGFINTIKHPEKLVYLDLRDNLFLPSKLEIFADFYQLKELYLGTITEFRIIFSDYNQFYGSLKPLENLKKLEKLCVKNTEVNRGFEYLPDSLKEISFSDKREKESGEDLGLTEIMEELALYENSVLKLKKSRNSKEEKIKFLNKKVSVLKTLNQTLDNSRKEGDKKIKELEEEKDKLSSINENSKNNEKKLKKELENLQREYKKEVKKNESLSQQLKDMESECSTFKQLVKDHLQDQRTKNSELEKQLSGLRNQKQHQQSQILQNSYSK